MLQIYFCSIFNKRGRITPANHRDSRMHQTTPHQRNTLPKHTLFQPSANKHNKTRLFQQLTHWVIPQTQKLQTDFNFYNNFRGNLLLTDLYLDGIPKFYLSNVDYSLASILPPRIRMEFVVNVDEVILEVIYDGAITLFNFLELFGTGEIK